MSKKNDKDDKDLEFSDDELIRIFENRFGDSEKKWNSIKKDFIEIGLENIVNENINGMAFHILYHKMTSFNDDEIFAHLMDDSEED